MSATTFNVGIVGATGAVGKEIVGCLEKRSFPVSSLRIFGSERSAGKEVDTKFGKVTVELFEEKKARECDVVFLAVDGDFSLKHAENICEGDEGAVVIDNSVSQLFLSYVTSCPLFDFAMNQPTILPFHPLTIF
jgi:aspartate-semialdehyde dehydrogenase